MFHSSNWVVQSHSHLAPIETGCGAAAPMALADCGTGYAVAGDQRRSRTQTMIIQSQQSRYGTDQISAVQQKKRLSAEPLHWPTNRQDVVTVLATAWTVVA
jgi:hypothetical protein